MKQENKELADFKSSIYKQVEALKVHYQEILKKIHEENVEKVHQQLKEVEAIEMKEEKHNAAFLEQTESLQGQIKAATSRLTILDSEIITTKQAFAEVKRAEACLRNEIEVTRAQLKERNGGWAGALIGVVAIIAVSVAATWALNIALASSGITGVGVKVTTSSINLILPL